MPRLSRRPVSEKYPGVLFILIASLAVLFCTEHDPDLFWSLGICARDFSDGWTAKGFLNLITYQFAHGSWAHWWNNMFLMTPFALYLESEMGTRNFMALFLLSGVGAAAMFMGIPQASDWAVLIGASGSVCGIVCVALVRFGWSSPVWRTLALMAMVCFIFPELCVAVLSTLMPDGIAHWGHIGGAATGITYLAATQKNA